MYRELQARLHPGRSFAAEKIATEAALEHAEYVVQPIMLGPERGHTACSVARWIEELETGRQKTLVNVRSLVALGGTQTEVVIWWGGEWRMSAGLVKGTVDSGMVVKIGVEDEDISRG